MNSEIRNTIVAGIIGASFGAVLALIAIHVDSGHECPRAADGGGADSGYAVGPRAPGTTTHAGIDGGVGEIIFEVPAGMTAVSVKVGGGGDSTRPSSGDVKFPPLGNDETRGADAEGSAP